MRKDNFCINSLRRVSVYILNSCLRVKVGFEKNSCKFIFKDILVHFRLEGYIVSLFDFLVVSKFTFIDHAQTYHSSRVLRHGFRRNVVECSLINATNPLETEEEHKKRREKNWYVYRRVWCTSLFMLYSSYNAADWRSSRLEVTSTADARTNEVNIDQDKFMQSLTLCHFHEKAGLAVHNSIFKWDFVSQMHVRDTFWLA
jgi:hypothetical protein